MLEGERITPGQDQPAVERRYQIREPMAGEVHDIGPPQRRGWRRLLGIDDGEQPLAGAGTGEITCGGQRARVRYVADRYRIERISPPSRRGRVRRPRGVEREQAEEPARNEHYRRCRLDRLDHRPDRDIPQPCHDGIEGRSPVRKPSLWAVAECGIKVKV